MSTAPRARYSATHIHRRCLLPLMCQSHALDCRLTWQPPSAVCTQTDHVLVMSLADPFRAKGTIATLAPRRLAKLVRPYQTQFWGFKPHQNYQRPGLRRTQLGKLTALPHIAELLERGWLPLSKNPRFGHSGLQLWSFGPRRGPRFLAKASEPAPKSCLVMVTPLFYNDSDIAIPSVRPSVRLSAVRHKPETLLFSY